jgi:hypothetical protein
MSKRPRTLLVCLVISASQLVSAAESAPLVIEAKVPLGGIQGRIDHLAVDVPRQRLYVAELGNNTMGVVDLKANALLRTIPNLRAPQGIGYVPWTDTVYVANEGDGSVRLFQGADLSPAGEIALGDDADNVRVDDVARRVWVGYGSGALAVIDPDGHRKLTDITLKAHPESFRLASSGSQVFVNVPEAGEIAVLDRVSNKQVAAWKTGELRANFPLALDGDLLLSVFRHPARLAVFRVADGQRLQAAETCGDSDDLFVDAKRHRVYVTCGEGAIDVFAREGDAYRAAGRLLTSPGARTSLFVPELDRLYVAVRASGATPAAIWVIRPEP